MKNIQNACGVVHKTTIRLITSNNFAVFFILSFLGCSTMLNSRFMLQSNNDFGLMDQKSYDGFSAIKNMNMSDKGMSTLLKGLEGIQLKEKKAFLGSGGFLSIGPEYVFKKEDLFNKGIFHKAGFKIEDYLSESVIKQLKFKKYNVNLIKLDDKEFMNIKDSLKNCMNVDDQKKLFSIYLEADKNILATNIKVPLQQHELDALLCASYNVGIPCLRRAKIFDLLNCNRKQDAAFSIATIRRIRLEDSCNGIWKNGKITKGVTLNIAEQNKSPQKFLHGWIKRDFIQANIFLDKPLFNVVKSPSSIVSYFSNTPYYDIADKFWYVLKNGKHKDWILNAVENISEQYMYL